MYHNPAMSCVLVFHDMDVSQVCVSCWLKSAWDSPVDAIHALYSVFPSPSWYGMLLWMLYVISLFILSLVIPDKRVVGRADQGTKYPAPVYRINAAYTVLAWSIGYVALVYTGIVPYDLIYQRFGEIFASANIFVCVLVIAHWMIPRFVTHRVSPLTTKCHIPWYTEWFYGVELHPSLADIDIKTFSYRPGMLGFVLITFTLACVQYKTYGTIGSSMSLFSIFSLWYTVDYFINEEAIITIYDIIEERWGWMLIFGDYIWIPFVFSIGAWCNVHHPESDWQHWTVPVSVLMFAVGYYIFRVSNLEKNIVKQHPYRLTVVTKGSGPAAAGLQSPFVGLMPRVVTRSYAKTQAAAQASSSSSSPSIISHPVPSVWAHHLHDVSLLDGKLLLSGWWGRLRKPNYLGDLLIAWAIGLCSAQLSLLALSYPIYLTILLVHRAYRDEACCRRKYGYLWDQYCKIVKWRIVPFIF